MAPTPERSRWSVAVGGFLLAAAARLGMAPIPARRWKALTGGVTLFTSWALTSAGLPHPMTVDPVGGVLARSTSGSGETPEEPGSGEALEGGVELPVGGVLARSTSGCGETPEEPSRGKTLVKEVDWVELPGGETLLAEEADSE